MKTLMILIVIIICACFVLSVESPSWAAEARKASPTNAVAPARPSSGSSNQDLKPLKKISDTKLPISIIINSPTNGDTVFINETYEIKWSHLGQMNTIVDIEASLVGTNTKFGIVGKTLNDGSYSWPVLGLKPGKYIIRIITADTAIKGESNPFDVVNTAVDMVTPTSGETWYTAETHNIIWKANMLPDGTKISIEFVKSGGQVFNLGHNLPNSGKFTWKVTYDALEYQEFSGAFSGTLKSYSDTNGMLKVTAVANGKTYIAERQLLLAQPNK